MFLKDIKASEAKMKEMHEDLEDEFRNLFTSENYAHNTDFYMDLCTGEFIYRVDTDKSALTESDLAQYPDCLLYTSPSPRDS